MSDGGVEKMQRERVVAVVVEASEHSQYEFERRWRPKSTNHAERPMTMRTLTIKKKRSSLSNSEKSQSPSSIRRTGRVRLTQVADS